jgi:hypothetical protein
VILHVLYKARHDDVRPVLEALTHLLHICDSLTQKRIEWVLGVAQLRKQSHLKEIAHFGCYGTEYRYLDETVCNYPSPLRLPNSLTVFEILSAYRKRNESLTIRVVKCLLTVCQL